MEIRGKRSRRLGQDRMKRTKKKRANGGGKVPFQVLSERATLSSPKNVGPALTLDTKTRKLEREKL